MSFSYAGARRCAGPPRHCAPRRFDAGFLAARAALHFGVATAFNARAQSAADDAAPAAPDTHKPFAAAYPGNSVGAVVAIGIGNLDNFQYRNFHPYPQRSYTAELRFDL